ncbi:MAG: sugar phosphate nucleotidyltransferase [Acidimicrobiales bacterium]
MRAIVLLGGSGTRLRPLTLDTPKQVLPIVEVPMIVRVLAHLERHGVSKAVLSLCYLNQAFVDLFPGNRAGGLELSYAVEPEPLDTGGAIAYAARTAGIDDDFLVVNGDVLTDLDITAMVERHRSTGAEATIALTKVADSSAFGLVQAAPDGRVRGFVEKPPPSEAGPGLINAGIYLFAPSVLDRVPAGRRTSVEREVFPELASSGRLYAFGSSAYWTDTGTPTQYLDAQLDILDGSSHLGPGARVAPGAKVMQSVIGAGARVREGATIEESVLLPGAVVGDGASVERSILGRGAIVGDGCRLSDLTVLGTGVEIAPGRTLVGARVPDQAVA